MDTRFIIIHSIDSSIVGGLRMEERGGVRGEKIKRGQRRRKKTSFCKYLWRTPHREWKRRETQGKDTKMWDASFADCLPHES